MHQHRSFKGSAAIVCMVLAYAGTAWAQKPKYTRASDVKINVKISDRVKPLDVKEKPESKQPSVSADQILNIEGLVGEIREEQAAILFDLIKDTPDSEADEKADYYFRLGELYAKQQRFYRLKSAEYAISADTAAKANAKADFKKKSEDAAAKSKKALLDAVKIYNALTDNPAFRNYPNMDKALFYYGYTLQGGTYMKEARVVYDKLLKNYPNSKYVPEAHLAFADYHFENNQLAEAEDRYRKVLKYPKSNAYWYSMYMLGWIDMNLSRYKDALAAFLQVAEATNNNKKQEILNRASKKDFVRAYAEIGKAEVAYQAFQRVDRKYAFTMLTMLGDRYLEQGKSEKAIYIFQELIKEAPKDKNVCLWQYNIAHSMLTVSGDEDKVKEIEKLTRMWGVLRDRKILPKAEAQECHDNAAAMSGELARAYHSESVRTKNPTTLAYADKLYHVYLEVFKDASDYAETEYYYAELLWTRAENEKTPRLQTELFENAAIAFTDVVKTNKVPAAMIKTAAYAAVLSWKNALNVDPRVKETPVEDEKNAKIPPKQPIPEREQKMLAAFDIYINYVKDPKDDELVGMKFLKANIYRRYNDFDKALPIFEEILDKHRDHETAEYAANLLLDTYNRMQRYDDMMAVATKLDADPKFLEGKEQLKKTISGLRITYERKSAESKEQKAKESGDLSLYVDCAESYIKIFNRDTNAKDADVLLYNAGVCFEQGKSIGAALSMFSKLAELYPDSKQTAKAIAKLGNNYGAIAYYDKAASRYEEYARKYAGEKDAFDAMSSAVFYRKGIGDDEKAIENTKFFIKTFGAKNPDKAAEAFFSLNTIYEKERDVAKASRKGYAEANDQVIKHLRQYISQYGKKGGADRMVMAWTKIGMSLWDAACPVRTVEGSCVKVTRERAVATSKRATKRRKGSSQPTQCGPESKIKLVTVNRDERMVKDAMTAFGRAIAEFGGGNDKGGDEGAGTARFWAGQARFYQAEKDYEEYLANRFPRGLDFDPNNKAIATRSNKRLTEWITTKTKTGETARVKYEGVIGNRDASSAIAAAARLGQIQQNFSDALFTAEIPEDVRTGQFADEKVEAFCDKLTELAEPLAAKSLDAYSGCLRRSTELGWFSEWSRLCERELGQIEPDKYPTASELRDTPDKIAPVTDIEPPTARLE